MARVRPSFIITEAYITRWPVYVMTEDDAAIGFYGFKEIDGRTFLADLWLEPAHIGKGHGRALWEHAVKTARDAGYPKFLIESDPNAERFYLRMGATRIGDIRSPDSGRILPLLEFNLATRL